MTSPVIKTPEIKPVALRDEPVAVLKIKVSPVTVFPEIVPETTSPDVM